MTDNERKLEAAEKKYSWLKVVNDFMPALIAFLLICVLTLCIILSGNQFKMMSVETYQTEFQKTAFQRRATIDSINRKMLDDNKIEIQLLTLILKNQGQQIQMLQVEQQKMDSILTYKLKK